MDGVCLNDNSRNLGGGGSTPRHVPSPIKTLLAGASHLRAMALANRIIQKWASCAHPLVQLLVHQK